MTTFETLYTFRIANHSDSPTFTNDSGTYDYFYYYKNLEDAKEDLELYFDNEWEDLIVVTILRAGETK